jgi:hypothetical protein
VNRPKGEPGIFVRACEPLDGKKGRGRGKRARGGRDDVMLGIQMLNLAQTEKRKEETIFKTPLKLSSHCILSC